MIVNDVVLEINRRFALDLPTLGHGIEPASSVGRLWSTPAEYADQPPFELYAKTTAPWNVFNDALRIDGVYFTVAPNIVASPAPAPRALVSPAPPPSPPSSPHASSGFVRLWHSIFHALLHPLRERTTR